MHYVGKGVQLILHLDGTKPIYVQVAEWLENEIMDGTFDSDEKVYSQYQLADMFNINPATAAKGLNLLVSEDILYKRRGLGMFVTKGAKEIVFAKRKNETLRQMIEDLVIEAERLGVGETELLEMIRAMKTGQKGEGT